jgi:hypothetical protein
MYILNTNVFLEPFKRFYPMDFCPGYWDWLDECVQGSNVRSIRFVYEEMKDAGDELSNWAKRHENSGFFMSEDATDIQAANQVVVQHIQRTTTRLGFRRTALADFLSGADPWLIAAAHARGGTVVTLEENNPDRRSKVLIPVVCDELRIPCVTPYQWLRRSGFKLVREIEANGDLLPF